MYHLIPFVKHWTEIYRPIVDAARIQNKKGKSFHCIESIANIANLSMKLPTLPSPFVAMESNIGGDISKKFLFPQYNVYFFVKSVGKAGRDTDLDDTETKEKALEIAMDFLNYLREQQESHADDHQFPLIGIDTENVHFETFGPIHDRWFAVGIAMNDMSKYSRCVDKNKYL